MSKDILQATQAINTPFSPLTILHTSDWHLGRRLYGYQRYGEFEAFLAWLLDTIVKKNVDVVIVAGDIFDTMTPSNRAQALYYEFLGQVSGTACQHIVIVAGNHDSPSFLDAPSQLLKFLNVHIIGTACEDVADEVLVLHDKAGIPAVIVAAVPYLRDRDVRSSSAGESMDSKDANVISGICAHYDAVAILAKQYQHTIMDSHSRCIPIIATGHLFAAGGSLNDDDRGARTADDGVRDLYVGNLGKISADMFDSCFDYVALGHLHVPQKVGGKNHIRYSGSPIAMGFGEARQQKQVLLVQFSAPHATSTPADIRHIDITHNSTTEQIQNKQADDLYSNDLFDFNVNEPIDTQMTHDVADNGFQASSTEDSNTHDDGLKNITAAMTISTLAIPSFQDLAQVSGDMAAIKSSIHTLTESRAPSAPIWLEVVYNGTDVVGNLREQVETMVESLSCAVLKIKNMASYDKTLYQDSMTETLQDLTELEVFERCLTTHQITESQKPELTHAYQEILANIHHKDVRAE